MLQLEDKLYTSTEVADILGVSLRSVYRYLEENKLQADIKTATGRHRFSKRNILEFLYPDGSSQNSNNSAFQNAVNPFGSVRQDRVGYKTPESEFNANVVKSNNQNAPKVEPTPIISKPEPAPAPKVVEEPVKEEEQDEEPIDWLAKFREAAKKYREEAEKVSEAPIEPVTPVKKVDAFEEPKRSEVFSSPIHAEKKEVRYETRKNYYRSSLGGLKDIAQNIDKGSRSSFLDYAFTLNAGLSLYKPIKPFSMLHVYVRPGDLSFFERSLGLTPSDETNAQLCLVISDDNSIYSKKDELHGLFVVSKEKLASDIRASGDTVLESDGSSILS